MQLGCGIPADIPLLRRSRSDLVGGITVTDENRNIMPAAYAGSPTRRLPLTYPAGTGRLPGASFGPAGAGSKSNETCKPVMPKNARFEHESAVTKPWLFRSFFFLLQDHFIAVAINVRPTPGDKHRRAHVRGRASALSFVPWPGAVSGVGG